MVILKFPLIKNFEQIYNKPCILAVIHLQGTRQWRYDAGPGYVTPVETERLRQRCNPSFRVVYRPDPLYVVILPQRLQPRGGLFREPIFSGC